MGFREQRKEKVDVILRGSRSFTAWLLIQSYIWPSDSIWLVSATRTSPSSGEIVTWWNYKTFVSTFLFLNGMKKCISVKLLNFDNKFYVRACIIRTFMYLKNLKYFGKMFQVSCLPLAFYVMYSCEVKSFVLKTI